MPEPGRMIQMPLSSPTCTHGGKKSQMEEMTILSEETIDECMEHHNFYATIDGMAYAGLQKTKYRWGRDISCCDPIPCKRCRLYRFVAVGVMDELHDLRHHVHGLEVCFEGRSHLTAQRAAGLFKLYNAACLKELTTTDAANTPGSSSAGIPAATTTGMAAAASTGLPLGNKGKGKEIMEHPISAQIRENAAHELTRLRNLPELKWTYGPDLTDKDVLEMVQRSIAVRGSVHSGYVDSLPCSENNSNASERSQLFHARSQIFSELGSDICDPPELSPVDYPSHFGWPPLGGHFINPPGDVYPSSMICSHPRNFMDMPPPARAAAFEDNSSGQGNAAVSGPVKAFSDSSEE